MPIQDIDEGDEDLDLSDLSAHDNASYVSMATGAHDFVGEATPIQGGQSMQEWPRDAMGPRSMTAGSMHPPAQMVTAGQY